MIRDSADPTAPVDPSAPPPTPEEKEVYSPPLGDAGEKRTIPPWFYSILMVPFGAATGYAGTTLGALLTRGGVTGGQLAALAATGTLPHTFKFLWSPVVDVTLTVKKWYFIAAIATAAGIAALGLWPATSESLWALTVLVFFGSLVSTVIGMAVDSFMAHCTPEEKKGRAGGWSMAGNLGGSGIGGGLGLFIAMRLPQQWMASGLIALMCVACCIPLLWITAPPRGVKGHTAGELLIATLKDLRSALREHRGMAALVLCAVPLGIGASGSLWPSMAPQWKTDEDTLALIGVIGGVVSIFGSLAGGFLCDRWSRQGLYVVFGFLVAGTGVFMALTERTHGWFIASTMLFSFTTGLSWAAYAAFVLEAIGKGAAATKFSAFASLANFPIWYMGHINGWTWDAWGANGMLYFEAAMGVVGAIIFLVVVRRLLSRASAIPKTSPSPPVPAPGG